MVARVPESPVVPMLRRTEVRLPWKKPGLLTPEFTFTRPSVYEALVELLAVVVRVCSW